MLPDLCSSLRRGKSSPLASPPSFPRVQQSPLLLSDFYLQNDILASDSSTKPGSHRSTAKHTDFTQRERGSRWQSHAAGPKSRMSACHLFVSPLPSDISPWLWGKSCCLSFSLRQLRAASSSSFNHRQLRLSSGDWGPTQRCWPAAYLSRPLFLACRQLPSHHVLNAERADHLSCLSLQGHQAHHEVSILTT